MAGIGAATPVSYKRVVPLGTRQQPAASWLAEFRGRTAVPALKATLLTLRNGAVNHDHGPEFLAEVRGIITPHLGHSNIEVRTMAGDTLARVNGELARSVRDLATLVRSRPQLNLDLLKSLARDGQPEIKEAARTALRFFVENVKIVNPAEVADILGNNRNRQKIDALLNEAVPDAHDFAKVRAVIYARQELRALAREEAAYEPARVADKIQAYGKYLETARTSPGNWKTEEAFLETPLFIDVEDETGSHQVAFELVDSCGSGGMGRIFFARKAGEQEAKFVVKVLKKVDDPNLMGTLKELFWSEGEKIVKIRHPNIIRGYGLGRVELASGTMPFMVMERVQTSLDKVMDKLTEEQNLYVAMKVMEGLEHAWSSLSGKPAKPDQPDDRKPWHLLHRDIKPENILIELNGKGDIVAVKIADFGLSKALSEVESVDDMTQTHMLMGTLSYLAPEIHEFAGTARSERGPKLEASGPKTDIYALGITLHKMLAGVYPNGRDFSPGLRADGRPKVPNADWGVFAQAKGQGRQYELVRPDAIPVELWPIIARMIEVDPAKRYQNYPELIADLARYLAKQHSGYSLETAITGIFSTQAVSFTGQVVDDVEVSRLAKLLPERDYQVSPPGLAQAQRDQQLLEELVISLKSVNEHDQHLPELELNLLNIKLWIRINTPKVVIDAVLQKLTPEEVSRAHTIIAEAERTLPAAAFQPNLAFARTEISRVEPTDKVDELGKRFAEIENGAHRPDAAEVIELSERIQAGIDQLHAKVDIEEGDSLVVLQLTGYAEILQAYIDKQGGE